MRKVDSAGVCPAWITSRYGCHRIDTVAVRGVPLCPVHRQTMAHFGELRLAGDSWMHAEPGDPPVRHADLVKPDGLNVLRDKPEPVEREYVFAEPEPIDGRAAVQTGLFG